MTKQNIVCIFAHPDDEAFGPGGMIAKWAQTNNVYLICVTDGSNPNAHIKDLANIRNEELNISAKILGIKKIFFLGFCDGELKNNIYHKVAKDIENILKELKPSVLLTFEMRGVSGHIDHVLVSLVSTYLFEKLKFIKKIYYYAELKLISKLMKNYFIYFPEGYDKAEVDLVENVSSVIDIKIKAIKSHISQTKDMGLILKKFKYLPAEEYFFVKEKNLKSKLFEAKYLSTKLVKALLH